MDVITTFIFLGEVVVKVTALGFILNGPQSYLLDIWNIIDIVIVLVSLIAFLPFELNLGILKIIRMVRLLRPLRVISKN